MFQRYKQVLIRVSFMFIIPLISLIHIYLNVYRVNTKEIATALDSMIPFVSAFVVPYLYWFIYVFAGLLYLAFTDGKKYYGLLTSIVTGMLISFVIFYFYPTTVTRPEVVGGGIFNYAMRVVYVSDNPYNCFPSIHVLNATLVSMFLMSKEKSFSFNMWALLSCVIINLSTMFTKQHVVLDVISGMTIAVIMYLVWSNENIWESKWFTAIEENVAADGVSRDEPKAS